MSQIMSTNDDLASKRRSSMAMEKNIEAFSPQRSWRLPEGGLVGVLEKLIALASLPIMAFLGFIFICLVVGLSFFLAVCRVGGLALGLFSPRSGIKPGKFPRGVR